MSIGRILSVDPAWSIPGGEVAIECSDFDTSNPGSCKAVFDGTSARIVGASPQRVLAITPTTSNGDVEVALQNSSGGAGNTVRIIVGRRLAEDLHLVGNPAFDPDDGSLYVTRSGQRGKRIPVSILRLDQQGELHSLHGEVVNPTGIAFDSTGQMFVSSRLDGTIYRLTPFHEIVPFARNLGIATGLAFDPAGRLYVGDRTGTIHRVNGAGESDVWALLEPSVAAYHMAFGPDGGLYVTGPTVSSFDAVMRVDEDGRASVFYRGLGRPQGLAFDREGNLYVAASLKGRRGIIRISPDAQRAELVVAGMNVVGLAFSANGDMIVATNEAVFSLPLGIKGTLVREN